MGLCVGTPAELLSQIISKIALPDMPKLLQSGEKDKSGPLLLASRWWIMGIEVAEAYLLVEFLGKEFKVYKIRLQLQGISSMWKIKIGELTDVPVGC